MKPKTIKLTAILMALLLLAGMIPRASAAEEARGYRDVDVGSWYYEAVDFNTTLGIINGVGSGRFAPDVTLSRAMAVTMLYRLEGSPDVAEAQNPFADVNTGSYYENAVKWGVSKGIVQGVSDDEFAPNWEITREQLACFIIRYAEAVQADFLENGVYAEQAFVDRDDTSAYALDAMDQMVYSGLYRGSGDGMMRPKATASRAEIAVVFRRLALMLEKLPGTGKLVVGEDCLAQNLDDDSNEAVISLSAEDTSWLYQALTQDSAWKATDPLDLGPSYRLNLWGAEYLLSENEETLGYNYVAPDGTAHGMLFVLQSPEKEMQMLLARMDACYPGEEDD